MVILRSALKVACTRYCTCAAENPGEDPEGSRPWTGFLSIVELEPYMLKAYLTKNSNYFAHICVATVNHKSSSGLKETRKIG